jgi:hypothetical protein
MDPVETLLAILGGIVGAAALCWLAVLVAVRLARRHRGT